MKIKINKKEGEGGLEGGTSGFWDFGDNVNCF